MQYAALAEISSTEDNRIIHAVYSVGQWLLGLCI